MSPNRLAWAVVLLAASISTTQAETACFGPSAQTGAITTGVCGSPALSEDWRGFTTGGSPCGTGSCPPLSGHYVAWTLSNSMTDPHSNVGPIVDGRLYVWLGCGGDSQGNGVNRLQASVVTDANVTGITSYNGWVSNATATELDLSTPFCDQGAILVAALDVTPATGGPETARAGSWGWIKARYE